SCEVVELELLENPNNITVESADPNFVLNDIQLTFRGIVGGYSGTSTGLTRMRYQFGTYANSVTEQTISGEWQQSYQMFGNIDLLQGINDIAEEGEEIPYHVGVAQVLEAYAYFLLVDYAGNVPYSQANNPEEFANPATDPGASVYDAQLALLDEAIANLSEVSVKIPQDIFYGDFDADNWISLANTLKIRAYLNLRLTKPDAARSGINSALASGRIINSVDEDFQFNYSNVQNPAESRHPFFTGNYQAAGSGQYMSNNLYDLMNAGDNQAPFMETGDPDPRNRYYFYRQTSSAPSGSNLPCEGDAAYDYCYVGNLYWGRDHTDDAGIPADNVRRSTYGVYPGGGAFDRDLFEQARAVSESMEGAGILPIYTSANTHFALAEAALTLNTGGGSPASLLEAGIRLSMEKVLDFPTVSTVNPDTSEDFEATQSDVNDYVSRVLNEFNSANAAGKLNIIARENLIASFGNGIEPYNTYRRTGGPSLQTPIIAAGAFPRIWRYPETEVDSNPNITQQPLTNRTFWDNNPPGFID
ncbi:MAG: SusD/RagB family nutrient-binding outer membrane lipoprotein, partial [Flavobacteriaceae bacterium]|nr:SusD/RagB family nutrient-binding outer membrane lipoprotein [Flavobacteriaceae bacterium]